MTDRECELYILSDGPEFNRIQKEVQKLRIQDKVFFKKWLPSRNDVFKEYQQADVFAYSSFFECGGYVLLEAMACGMPAVTLNLGGPSEIIDESCGIKIASSTPEQIIDDFTQAFLELANNPKLLAEKRLNTARRIMQTFQWNVKGERILETIYSKLLVN